MKLYIGADHRGFEYKEALVSWLTQLDHEVTDCGNTTYDLQDDYVDFALTVAEKVAQDSSLENTSETRGILICGSGVGVNIAANKVPGIRASIGFSVEEVSHARNNDDINVLALSAEYLDIEKTKELILNFITEPFHPEERYIRRIEKIYTYETKDKN